jgi:hypothetical protein
MFYFSSLKRLGFWHLQATSMPSQPSLAPPFLKDSLAAKTPEIATKSGGIEVREGGKRNSLVILV